MSSRGERCRRVAALGRVATRGRQVAGGADELRLPEFRVPAPRNSAGHRSAALQRSHSGQHQDPAQQAPVRHPTRQLTREPESRQMPSQFAGIDLLEFALARQHARRMVLIWVAVVLSVTGMVAAAAWTIGSNLSGLL